MEYDYSSISVNLKRLRKKRSLTQDKLSELAGISTQHLCRIENGARTPSLETVHRIANALETTPELLLGIKKEIDINYEEELKSIFEDCNEYEKGVIGELLVNTKRSIRKNLPLLKKDK